MANFSTCFPEKAPRIVTYEHIPLRPKPKAPPSLKPTCASRSAVRFCTWAKVSYSQILGGSLCKIQTIQKKLVVSTHLKNISQNWIISPGRSENKKYLKPPPSIYMYPKSAAIVKKNISLCFVFFGKKKLEPLFAPEKVTIGSYFFFMTAVYAKPTSIPKAQSCCSWNLLVWSIEQVTAISLRSVGSEKHFQTYALKTVLNPKSKSS